MTIYLFLEIEPDEANQRNWFDLQLSTMRTALFTFSSFRCCSVMVSAEAEARKWQIRQGRFRCVRRRLKIKRSNRRNRSGRQPNWSGSPRCVWCLHRRADAAIPKTLSQQRPSWLTSVSHRPEWLMSRLGKNPTLRPLSTGLNGHSNS